MSQIDEEEAAKYEAFGSALMALRDVDGLSEGEFIPNAEHVKLPGSEKAGAVIEFMCQSGDFIVLVKLYDVESPLGEFVSADIIVSEGDGSSSTETINIYNNGDAAELRNLVETEVEVIKTIG